MIKTKFSMPPFLLLLLLIPFENSLALSLSPKEVADLLIKQSYRAQEINLTAQQSRLALATAKKIYDFSLTADGGYQVSHFESATNTYLMRNDSTTTNLTLSKLFSTGTSLSLGYLRSLEDPELSPSSPSRASSVAIDTVSLVMTQNLMRNFFGEADRADVQASENNYQAAQVTRENLLQELVLEGIRSYWTAFVAQQTYLGALNSKNRYEKLVEQIKKKTRYGYSNPGELAQAQAELEVRQQNTQNFQVLSKAAMDSLVSLIKLPPGTEITFTNSEKIPALPVDQPLNIEDLRPLKSSKLKLQAAESNLTSTQSKNRPDLSLVGKWYQQGLEQKNQDSFQEMSSGTHPKYYLGLQFQYAFGSGYTDEDFLNKKVTRDLAATQLERSRLELKDKENNLRRKLQSTYAIAQSAQKQKGFREQAAQELTKSYTQGRTDISLLISALNNYFDSEVQLTRSLGDYQIALTEWSAFRDELISNGKLSASENE